MNKYWENTMAERDQNIVDVLPQKTEEIYATVSSVLQPEFENNFSKPLEEKCSFGENISNVSEALDITSSSKSRSACPEKFSSSTRNHESQRNFTVEGEPCSNMVPVVLDAQHSADVEKIQPSCSVPKSTDSSVDLRVLKIVLLSQTVFKLCMKMEQNMGNPEFSPQLQMLLSLIKCLKSKDFELAFSTLKKPLNILSEEDSMDSSNQDESSHSIIDESLDSSFGDESSLRATTEESLDSSSDDESSHRFSNCEFMDDSSEEESSDTLSGKESLGESSNEFSDCSSDDESMESSSEEESSDERESSDELGIESSESSIDEESSDNSSDSEDSCTREHFGSLTTE